METIIYRRKPQEPQLLAADWYATPVVPPLEYSFELTDAAFIFRAARKAPAIIHPEARPGCFQPELWKYDTAEFFIAAADASHYMEFNLCPNGAWWAQSFAAARVPADAAPPAGVVTQGTCTPEGWACEASIPRCALEALGLDPTRCRLVVTAILNTPKPIFLTGAENLVGEPDFHRPADWPMAQIV